MRHPNMIGQIDSSSGKAAGCNRRPFFFRPFFGRRVEDDQLIGRLSPLGLGMLSPRYPGALNFASKVLTCLISSSLMP
jgi:hypothetical protein